MSEGDIAMQPCASYGVTTTKSAVDDQVYEECDIQKEHDTDKAYEELYN